MRKITDKLRRINPFARKNDGPLPRPLPGDPSLRVVKVFVEGYEDVAFWRGVFDCFANPYLYFEISVPTRKDLPKGKKVLMSMIPESSERMLLCVDSDFDFLFNGATEQSRLIRDSRYMFHTYTYATENYLCYAPSLHNVCVKATKNDTRIFDFERFMADYSRTIYRLFLWYAYSAKLSDEHVFTLVDFKSSVRLNYLDLEDNGARTIAWLQRNVARREQTLASKHPKQAAELDDFAAQLGRLGVTPETTYLYMHGHTLMDNVVMVSGAMGNIYEDLFRISSEDVCIGISFPRYSNRTIDALDFARGKGATIIAITDSVSSPIAEKAEHALIARSDMAGFADSLVAPLSLINAIIVACSLRRREQVSDTLSQLEGIWGSHGVYVTKESGRE